MKKASKKKLRTHTIYKVRNRFVPWGYDPDFRTWCGHSLLSRMTRIVLDSKLNEVNKEIKYLTPCILEKANHPRDEKTNKLIHQNSEKAVWV